MDIRRRGILIVAAFGATVIFGSAGLETDAVAEAEPHLSFEIEVNGVRRPVMEGEVLNVELPEGAKSAKIAVRRAAKQRYDFNSIHFMYDTSLSIDDDKEEDTRTVTLVDAQGFSIVISDLGTPDATSLDQLTRTMTKDLLSMFGTDPIKDIRTTEPVAHAAARVSGMSSTIEYTDSDGDRNFSQIYVFRNAARDFSVIVNYTGDNAGAAKRSLETVLSSLIAGDNRA